jgi:3-methyladenine DNA glycosylase AlkD
VPSQANAVRRDVAVLAKQIRELLAADGSKSVALSSQRFFTHPIEAHGWRTAALRRFAHQQRKLILKNSGLHVLVKLADELFRGPISEEKTFAVLALEQSAAKLGDQEFCLLEEWLDRVSNWGDHDGLTMYLLGPMMAAHPERAESVHRWVHSQNLWRRRASAVSLIRGIRRGMFWAEAQAVAKHLLADDEIIVQKGLGWMLREAAKQNARRTVPFLVSIRANATRLALRTACETMSRIEREKVLG